MVAVFAGVRTKRPGVSEMGIEFGKLLRELREQRGLRQDDIATAANVSQGYISSIENGTYTKASKKVVAAICRLLGVPDDTFALSLLPDPLEPAESDVRKAEDPVSVSFEFELPLLGVVAAGPGAESDYAVGEHVRFADLFRGADGVYQCAGESMRGEGVLPGDFLAVRRDSDPPAGATVFCRLDGGGHVVKVLAIEGGIRKLMSRPGDRRPDPITLIEGDVILGVMVGVIRSTKTAGKNSRRK